jgi:hypothetical protein
MHDSYFMVVDEDHLETTIDLSLSPEFSEWLFESGFWMRLDSKFPDLAFDQYEEETIDGAVASDVAHALDEVLEKTDNCPDEKITFSYGWTSTGEALVCSLDKKTIKDESALLREFMRMASKNGKRVYCQL